MLRKMMKNIFKYLLFIGALSLIVKVLIPRDLNLSANDEEYIRKEIFGKDSENRGYSDRAKMMMYEDVKLFHNDKKLINLYDKYLKQQRLVVQSKSQNEYYIRYLYYRKIMDCIVVYSNHEYPRTSYKHLLSRYNMESDRMTFFLEDMHSQYVRTMSYDLKYQLYNESFTKEECYDLAEK